MTEAQQMTAHINGCLPNVKAGALCFWGEWFGRPYDNIHQIVSCEVEGEVLKLHFNEDETLFVWSPHRLKADQKTFRISGAAKVRWEWFYYGLPKIEINRYFMEFVKDGNAITATTNVNWYTPSLQPNPNVAACRDALNFHGAQI
jgi:hypothetical protein